MSNKKQKYVGIIDAHGLETLQQKTKENAVFFYMRATLNRQRHSTYFEIEVEPLVAANIIDVCAGGDPPGACVMVQKQETLKVPDCMEDSVGMLPDSTLDPWN